MEKNYLHEFLNKDKIIFDICVCLGHIFLFQRLYCLVCFLHYLGKKCWI